MHFGARTALNFSALSNNPDLLEGFRVTPRGLKLPQARSHQEQAHHTREPPAGKSVNDGIPKASHLEMARIRNLDERIRECYDRTGEVWMAKADIKAAYRNQPVRPEGWQLQGIKWKDK